MTEPLTVAFVAAVFLLAGTVKGVIGLGLPTIAMGLLGSAMPSAAAAALLIAPSLVTNLWQIGDGAGGWRGVPALLRRLWPFLLGIAAGTWAGAGLLAGTGTRTAMVGLGAALLAYAVFGLAAPRLPVLRPSREAWLGPLIGASTGAITAATGVFVIPAVPYLGALGLPRDALVGALGLSFLVSTIALGASLGTSGAFTGDLALGSVLAVAPALAGMALGGAIRRRVRPETFRRWFFLGLLVLGAQLVLRGLGTI